MKSTIHKPLSDPDTYETSYYDLRMESLFYTVLPFVISYLLGACTVVFGLFIYIWLFLD